MYSHYAVNSENNTIIHLFTHILPSWPLVVDMRHATGIEQALRQGYLTSPLPEVALNSPEPHVAHVRRGLKELFFFFARFHHSRARTLHDTVCLQQTWTSHFIPFYLQLAPRPWVCWIKFNKCPSALERAQQPDAQSPSVFTHVFLFIFSSKKKPVSSFIITLLPFGLQRKKEAPS